MSAPKLFFNTNIRFLRERKGLTQDALGQELGITRNKLQALESGKTVNPILADVVMFSRYFGISVDSLLKVELNTLGELQLRELEAGNDVYITGRKMRVLAITVDKDNRENTEYVPIAAKAGYAAGYTDPEFIAALPRFSLPNLPATGTFRMFPTEGDSMLPIPENSDVVAQYVEDWSRLPADTPCIVILRNGQGFVFKLLTMLGQGKVLLKSLNTVYAPYQVNAEDILEVWRYYKHQTGTLPPPETGLQELKTLVQELKHIVLERG